MDAARLIEEATRRSGVVWIRPTESPRTHAVWHVWHEGAMYVVSGGVEQPSPVAAQATVSVRSKQRQGDLLVEWVADVDVVAPGSPLWDEVVPLLHAGRLNAPDGQQQPVRWVEESVVQRFTPTGETVPIGDASRAAAPVDSPATTR